MRYPVDVAGVEVEAVPNTGVQVSKLMGILVSGVFAGVESGANSTSVTASLDTLECI